MSIIQLDRIDVDFSPKKGKVVKAVSDVTLHVEKGDIYGVVGFPVPVSQPWLERLTSCNILARVISRSTMSILLKKANKLFLINNCNWNVEKSA